jgi:hypothetical protein
MLSQVKQEWSRRPIWMNLIFMFCLFMTFIYSPFDMFTKPLAEAEDVWFGYTFRDWPAKFGEVVHWIVYGFGAYGFWKMKSWMWPWAGVYCLQVTIAMVVFSLLLRTETGFDGLLPALISGSIFAIPTIALFRARTKFQTEASATS